MDSDLEIYADDWNYICWKGSLNKQVEKVMFACEKAVKIAPNNGLIRNNRGFARALTSDLMVLLKSLKCLLNRIIMQNKKQNNKVGLNF
ncbi:MAG: hypothetical protein F6K23_15770 [Okeania sp. SIO2C9]|uniref:hypothetical protein n=1 Tax=Okeania sp. SIO2C9 TaxID=2607791 RepID=UPI0013C06F89|nr:hypothetical protein [Okeania sp. SIO2C9]NEQ74357.1 hypothetical protein [Okeania sp. SIO2C9]